jgi:hypothetical protein
MTPAFGLIAMLSVLSLGCSVVSSDFDGLKAAEKSHAPLPTIRVYREQHYTSNPNGGDCLLTVNPQADPGYASEGDILGCWGPDDAGTRVRLYRRGNASLSDHVHTSDETEAHDVLNHGYIDEGITCYVYPSQQFSDLVPLYRLSAGPPWTMHYYTTNWAMVQTITSSQPWKYESIIGWVYGD